LPRLIKIKSTFHHINKSPIQQININMNFPSNFRYTEDHEWIHLEGGNIALVGITDFAQGELGELVYIEVETVGETLDAGAVFGTVEAVKTTSDLLMPVKGKVVEFNSAVGDSGDPAIVNEDPYGRGWLVKIEVSNPSDLDGLMTAAAYQKHIGK
jgi:glycine cleavage system H protein